MPDELMKVAVVRARGAADFTIERRPIPRPGPGQVLIRVMAAGVNFSDIKRRRGDVYPFPTEFPFVPGGEIAGVIEAVGAGVDTVKPDMRVLALAGPNGFGGYAQFALSYAPTVVPLPPDLGFDEASTLLVAGTTAQLMLSQTAKLVRGESILIPAGAGGVASFAIQIAKAMGAGLVIAAVGDESKAAGPRAHGADLVISTAKSDWPQAVLAATDGQGVDIALEATGDGSLADTLACLAPFGRLVVYGAATGLSARIDRPTLDHWLYAPAPNQSIAGFNVGDWFMKRPAMAGQALGALMSHVLEGRITTPALTRLPLEAAPDAHRLLEQRKVQGKIVLNPWA